MLGLEDNLFGVTHECDYPDRAKTKPNLTQSLLNASTSFEIDRAVRESLKGGRGVYSINEENLRKAAPDIIFTQELCEVCAVPYGEIFRASRKLPSFPEIVSLDTFTLNDILQSIGTVAKKCGKEEEGKSIIRKLEERIETAKQISSSREKKRVLFIEWVDPIMSCGHWMPELIDIAGGRDLFGVNGKNSKIINWKAVLAASPDYLIIAPCGFNTARAYEEARHLTKLEGWEEIPAVRNKNVYVADGNAHFSRPGPRIVDGLEILVSILNLSSVYAERYIVPNYLRFP
jgi:iron complex transport system substrate-binding protein